MLSLYLALPLTHLDLFFVLLFFFNDTATTEIYTLSLHDALPISVQNSSAWARSAYWPPNGTRLDRKSTRLNSSHPSISYAVFCLKKKKKEYHTPRITKKKQHKDKKIQSRKLS